MTSKVVVLMSTYNGEKYLNEQIDSIINQKGDFELDLLIRDDGSTDNTRNILAKYENNESIYWYGGENLKPAKSFIDLILKVENKYDFFAFSDQDDFWMENKIEEAIERIKDEDLPTIYFSNAELVNSKLDPLKEKLYKTELKNDIYTTMCAANIIGCTMVFNKKMLEVIKQGGMPETVIMHDSYLSRVCMAIGGKIIYDSNAYIKYRQHQNNVLGVKSSIISKLHERLQDIFTKSDITIDEQVREILRIYGNIIP